MAQGVGKHSIPQPERHTGRIVASVACALVLALGLGVGLALSQGLIGRPAPSEDDRTTTTSTPPPESETGKDTGGGETEPPAGSADEQENTTEDDQKRVVELPAVLRDVSSDIELSNTKEGFSSSTGYAQLTQAVGGFEDEGHQLSFYLKDLTTGATISYQADEPYYPASSIKGPYVVAVYETLVDTGRTRASSVAGLAESAIVNSDNNAFRSLRETYGASVFGTWLQSFGFDTSGYGGSHSYRAYYYPYTSATQLAEMWEHMYEYLSSGTDSADYLVSLFEQREVSPIADAVGAKYKSWGKAGWYASREGQGTRPTTVDAGIVFADARPYLVVAMSDAPSELEELTTVFVGLEDAHETMV